MDYLLTCLHPSDVCYVRYLQAYANGCHILNLPFVETIAKVDFECMLRKRFFNACSEEDELAILESVLKAAYIPLMPAWFFEKAGDPAHRSTKAVSIETSIRNADFYTIKLLRIRLSTVTCIVTETDDAPTFVLENSIHSELQLRQRHLLKRRGLYALYLKAVDAANYSCIQKASNTASPLKLMKMKRMFDMVQVGFSLVENSCNDSILTCLEYYDKIEWI